MEFPRLATQCLAQKPLWGLRGHHGNIPVLALSHSSACVRCGDNYAPAVP